MGERQRILITVKTYPTLSRKYGETVCTAGLREDGTWVRLYPVPFRRLDQADRYSKYDWIECRLQRNQSDPRPETFRLIDQNELRPVAHMSTEDNWRERRQFLLKTTQVYDRLDDVISSAKANRISLAIFRPTRVVDFVPWCINTGKSLIPLTLLFLHQKRNLLIPLELSRVMHQGIEELTAENAWFPSTGLWGFLIRTVSPAAILLIFLWTAIRPLF